MPSRTNAHFDNPRHRASANFLRKVCDTGKLGPGPVETDIVHRRLYKTLWRTFPWVTLSVQFVWSSIVLTIAYFVSNASNPGKPLLDDKFWISRVNVSSTVSYGVGWALFVLLSLYVREASKRYVGAQISIQHASAALKRVVRIVRQCYPAGMWHEGDHERLMAHIVAYPIALKMTLRRERTPDQLAHLLHPDDVSDIVSGDLLHLQCLRVVRSYLTAAEDDNDAFRHIAANETLPGADVRRVITEILDSADLFATSAVQVAHFRPASSYINHLRIFLYIWLMFLPLAVVGPSGL